MRSWGQKNGRAPVVETRSSSVLAGCRLQSGDPAAHGMASLPLLPPGPDGVRRIPLRRTRPSTSRAQPTASRHGPSDGDSAPLRRIADYRAPPAPRLARPPQGYLWPVVGANGPPGCAESVAGHRPAESAVGRRSTPNPSPVAATRRIRRRGRSPPAGAFPFPYLYPMPLHGIH